MILESAVLDVRPDRRAEFLAAFGLARPLIAAQPGFLGLRLLPCLDPGHESRFLLQVEWRRLEDHTEGFRRSAEYPRWGELLHPYYDPFPLVEHYGEPVLEQPAPGLG
ncbi:antibiotic biosynthesis monooxygenase family protein [Streptacidiphilus cavernicola]|uniref:Antibiotic biosynthesis monooxygenase n=1 Tax=Streptacidiphilus cavernicola TaxID=3342716 RepID=A0ABV6VRT2_9ACTN